MSAGQESTITRGFLFADLRGYTDFVEQRGAAAAAALLTQYGALARDAIGQFGGADRSGSTSWEALLVLKAFVESLRISVARRPIL